MYSNESGKYSGYSVDLLDELAMRLNFKYDILFQYDHFGHMTPNGWDNVMRDLIERSVDIGLGSMSVTAEREVVVDFTVSYYDLVGITILMKKIELERTHFRFLTVLETSVWLCIIAIYFGTRFDYFVLIYPILRMNELILHTFYSFIMWLFDKLSPFSYQNNQMKLRDDTSKRLFTFNECLWFCITSMTPQGGGEAPRCLSAKIVAATWWLFG